MPALRLRRKAAVAAAFVVAGLVALLLVSPASRSGAAPARASWWHLPAKPTWYWQLQGKIDMGVKVAMYDLDGFDTSAAQVAKLHAEGRHVACYIDVGTWESWRPDAHEFPKSVLGRPNGWPGERWLDTRRLSVLEPIMTRRMAMCAAKGFDVVEPDNIDPLGNHPGFPLTRAVVIRYARWVAAEAHHLGLAVLQKNGPELASALEPDFDGALSEQCSQYEECGRFAPYLRARKPVLDAEYDPKLYPGFCAADDRRGIQGVLYNFALNGRRYRPCPAAVTV